MFVTFAQNFIIIIRGRKYRRIGVRKIGNGFRARYKKGLFNSRVFLKVAGFSGRIYSYFKNIRRSRSFKPRQLFNVINIFLDLFGFCFYNKGAVKGFPVKFLRKKVYYYFNSWRGWF